MRYKPCLIHLVIIVALTLTILQFFTTTITFTEIGNKMLRSIIQNRSLQNNNKLRILGQYFRINQSKNATLVKHITHVSKKFAKLQHRQQINQKLQKQRKQEYKILFWGKFYGYSNPSVYCIEDQHAMDFCEYKCEYSFDQSEQSLNQSDAIVIHGRDTVTDLPSHRAPHQRWVFLMLEAPKNSWTNLSSLSNTINWTMSYRSDSDVFIPYGKLIPNSEATDIDTAFDEEENFQLSTENLGFKKLAAWAVSNCQKELVSSERKAMVDELSKFMPIDVYGTCGLYQCPGTSTNQCTDPEKCFKHLGPRYKFYFAFENSICEDYITEKFFLALAHGMVPVVHGPKKEDYLKHAPDHSFIHVEDYPNLKELADYLIHLNENDEEYLQYFRWREEFVMDKVYYFQRAWCNLCTKLHEPIYDKTKASLPSIPSVYSSINDWWFYKGDAKNKSICRGVEVSKDGTFKYE